LFDMSGNLREWTDDQRGKTAENVPSYVVRGGAYHTPVEGLTCNFELSQAVADVVLPAIGFRCCSSNPP
jgi:formylglycine-generating enzyme required for sulfatase activity